MSRTYKDRGRRRRLVKNSLYKKHLHMYGEDFLHKKKDRTLSRVLRRRLKEGEEDERRNINGNE